MKRTIKILGALCLWILMCISCYCATTIFNLKNSPKYKYRYVDINGNSGISNHCFESDGIDMCKIGKHTKRVISLEKYEV